MTEADATLNEHVRSGHASASDLAHAYGVDCYRLASRLLGRADDARDCVQDAFVRVLRHLDRWRCRSDSGPIKAWMLRIVANEAFRSIRAARRRRRMPRLAETTIASPADDVAQREADSLVRTALSALPRSQRETIMLRHYGGLSLAEIAECRRCALGTVKATLFAAYQALRPPLAKVGATSDRPAGGLT